ncbi:DUF6273 domain-containing protein [Bifidobacterium moukalabense]|uniref:DUF6273 domain-containing protein n=1 Tax=Bifidobacterium moukalabense TaxID=1333651 RepID=UPI0010F7F2C2|nr:DUF6273 domain-containing protein [Bifidobacterium moukalabense]
MTRHKHNIVRHHARGRACRALAAIMALAVAVGGGLATSTALADEPQQCGVSDSVCYAGYNANGLKRIATDLSENGTGSQYYAIMESNLQKDVRGSITLSDGSKLPFRLIGVLHDDLADGSGRKAGLTFMAVNAMPKAYCMIGTMPSDNTTSCSGESTNWGGWRDSRLRQWMNGGEVWNMFPQTFRDNVSTVLKQTNNMEYGNTAGSAASATSDRLWLVSYRELVPTLYDGWKTSGGFQTLSQEGSQYEFFKGRVTNNYSSNRILQGMYKTASGSSPAGIHYDYWWERSSHPRASLYFLCVGSDGNPRYYSGLNRRALVPAFSF